MYIYALVDPRTGRVRYIGKAKDPAKRLIAHKRDKPHLRKTRWLRQLQRLSLEPQIILLETVNSNWQEAERRWIKLYRQNGCDLTNLTDGGDGVPGLDETSRKRLSDARLRLYQAADFRARMLTVVRQPLRCTKIAEALTGKPKTAKHVEKSAAAHRGKKLRLSPAEQLSRKTRGHRWSPQEIEILRCKNEGNQFGFGNRSRTGQKRSAEERRKVSLALKGRPKTTEWKQKMREIALKCWEDRRLTSK